MQNIKKRRRNLKFKQYITSSVSKTAFSHASNFQLMKNEYNELRNAPVWDTNKTAQIKRNSNKVIWLVTTTPGHSRYLRQSKGHYTKD